MQIRRLTPSPTASETSTFLPENSYLVSLRPRDLQDQILESLRLNDLPLVNLDTSLALSEAKITTQSLDFQIIQRLLGENHRVKLDLIALSLASYRSKEMSSLKGAETLLNYLLSKFNEQELNALQEILKTEIIDDSILGNLVNMIRLTGVGDPVKFMELLDNCLRGTLNLRKFMGSLDNSTEDSMITLEKFNEQRVAPEIIEQINQKEREGLSEVINQANNTQVEYTNQIDVIRQTADFQRLILNTGITFGVSGLMWAGYRFGVWEFIVNSLNNVVPQTNRQTDPGLLGNLQLGVAGLTGFLLKKGLLRPR